MQKLSIVFVLALAGCGSCSDASSSSTPAPTKPTANAPAAPAAPTQKPSLGDSAKPGAGRGAWGKGQAELDTNGDGIISDEERDAALSRRAVSMHQRLDKDGDGKVTQAELEADPRLARRLGDPSKIDTNHDGDISVEELQAALKSRYDEWRGRRGSGSGQ
jgi:hypothetical protein